MIDDNILNLPFYNVVNGDGKRKYSNEAMRQAEFDISPRVV